MGWDEPGGYAFISYVRDDRQRVDRLQDALQAAGIKVWRDTATLWPGQDWKLEIRRAIETESLAFIACFSENSERRSSGYQNEELIIAVEQMRRRRPGLSWLIPVRFAECNIPEFDLGAGRYLASLHCVDLFDGSWDITGTRLVGAVLRVLAGSPDRDGRPESDDGHSREISRALPSTAESVMSARKRQILERAGQVVPTIADPERQVQALWELAKMVRGEDRHRADELVDQAVLVLRAMPSGRHDWLLEEICNTIVEEDADRSEDIAGAITDPNRQVTALVGVAEAVGRSDPAKARRILGETERIARSISSKSKRDRALAAICQPLTSFDANRGERAARAIADPGKRAGALARLSNTKATSDPRRASRLAADADRMARSHSSQVVQVEALAAIADAVASDEPARTRQMLGEAERIARTVADPYWKHHCLNHIVEAALPHDLDRAESAGRAALTIDISYGQRLSWVVEAALPDDPERAERVARALPSGDRVHALLRVAESVVADDPDCAERIARDITDPSPYWMCSVLVQVAGVVVAYDPQRANDIISEVEDLIDDETYEPYPPRILGMAGVAIDQDDPDRASKLYDRAEKLARTIPEPAQRASALVDLVRTVAASQPDRADSIATTLAGTETESWIYAVIARAVAPSDPERAERMADAITDPDFKFWTLMTAADAT